MSTRSKKLTGDALRALLQERGVRVTDQRLLLLRELSRWDHPVSHAELTEALADTSLDRVTIYRNLVSMSELGILVRTKLADGVWRFELPHGRPAQHDRHPHFVCTECGEVSCLERLDVTLRGRVTENEVTEVQVRGRCAQCRH